MTWNNAKINLSRAVRRMSTDETLTLENFETSGMRIGGRWVDSNATTTGITASVQPLEKVGEETEQLPQGFRTQEMIGVWSLSEVRPLAREDGKKPSLITWRGKKFSVERVENYYEHGRYWYALCSQVQQ